MTSRPFIHEDFLLQNETARKLYHGCAAGLPIVDFHCHLSPAHIAANHEFRNLTNVWLDGDHYKWRAMRAMGVPETHITGTASDFEKFLMWARTVPHTLKNPLYHWVHLELKRYFGIDLLLNENTAEEIWETANAMLATPEFSTRRLLDRMNVQVVCTTDDAVDSLEHHIAYTNEINGDSEAMQLYPTFRPDNAMKVEDPVVFNSYVQQLSDASGIRIISYTDFLAALQQRHDHFGTLGCRASDHGLEEPYADDYTIAELRSIFAKAMQGQAPDASEVRKFKSALMHEFAIMNAEKGWVFQMHIGAMRNNNTRALLDVGTDAGFDSIGAPEVARPLSRFLDRLDLEGVLPKTILYNLNSRDNEIMATISGNFMDTGCPGKVQHGPAWWFHDQKEGMEQQLQILANYSLMSNFVGMVTDSRSFMSYPRHEYFRRILCNMLGDDAEKGIVPKDETMLCNLIQKMCYTNAVNFLGYQSVSATQNVSHG
jgi:glucuronate isomerase